MPIGFVFQLVALYIGRQFVEDPVAEASADRSSHWASHGANTSQLGDSIAVLSRIELFTRLSAGESIAFVDVREVQEFDRGHLPGAVSLPFSQRGKLYASFERRSGSLVVPYCNWDFRAYAAGMELQRQGLDRDVAMMFPHGIRSWVADGLPVAGSESGLSDEDAYQELLAIAQRQTDEAAECQGVRTTPASGASPPVPAEKHEVSAGDGGSERDLSHVKLDLFPKLAEPARIDASLGDQVCVEITAHDEDHWLVMPDFDVSLHLAKDETRTIELLITRAGFLPYGCITCCTRYRCQTYQGIVVNETHP